MCDITSKFLDIIRYTAPELQGWQTQQTILRGQTSCCNDYINADEQKRILDHVEKLHLTELFRKHVDVRIIVPELANELTTEIVSTVEPPKMIDITARFVAIMESGDRTHFAIERLIGENGKNRLGGKTRGYIVFDQNTKNILQFVNEFGFTKYFLDEIEIRRE